MAYSVTSMFGLGADVGSGLHHAVSHHQARGPCMGLSSIQNGLKEEPNNSNNNTNGTNGGNNTTSPSGSSSGSLTPSLHVPTAHHPSVHHQLHAHHAAQAMSHHHHHHAMRTGAAGMAAAGWAASMQSNIMQLDPVALQR